MKNILLFFVIVTCLNSYAKVDFNSTLLDLKGAGLLTFVDLDFPMESLYVVSERPNQLLIQSEYEKWSNEFLMSSAGKKSFQMCQLSLTYAVLRDDAKGEQKLVMVDHYPRNMNIKLKSFKNVKLATKKTAIEGSDYQSLYTESLNYSMDKAENLIYLKISCNEYQVEKISSIEMGRESKLLSFTPIYINYPFALPLETIFKRDYPKQKLVLTKSYLYQFSIKEIQAMLKGLIEFDLSQIPSLNIGSFN